MDTRGPIPFDRHDAALKNARQEAAAEAVKQFAWAQGYSQQEVEAAIGLARRLNGDSRGFYQQLGQELGLNQQPPAVAQPSPDEQYPEPDLISEDGRRAHSDKNLAKIRELDRKAILAEVQQQFAPVTEVVQGIAAERQQAAVNKHYGGIATDALTEARQLPQWKEHEGQIRDELQKLDTTDQGKAHIARVGAVAAMYGIYNRIVLPKLQQPQPGMVNLADLQRKASAEHGHASANGSTNAAAPKLRNVQDLAKHMERLEASMSR